ncbi:actin cytoskeleton-regulatory complex protein PAN1 isoform X2 [Brachypodium distachyon]|uniref:actin cytoskeleton-regulatory complex protein PAN1 isoform X2 n=1 Tax=Brachypodium distachyon TaxID=15368 RepID=UPI000D0D5AD9|nr:actin cytoskeleton-regulatory complex protein PAN1 isoform X2 [Brachypodium distachyon]|eukprot:XP_024314238.1 actin cytoskeleton-regulatory complex protein PAN1 isoform X2 [Brachypodium distachyon]
MSAATIHASAVLRRRAKEEEDSHMAGDDAYWSAAPRLYDFSTHDRLKLDPSPPPPSPPASPSSPSSPVPAQEPCGHLCLLALQGTGVSWGVRKRVHYVGRVPRRSVEAQAGDDRRPDPPAPAAVVQSAAVMAAPVVVQGDEESSSNAKNDAGAGAALPEAALAAAVAGTETKKKRRRRKPGRGRGFSLRPKKRVRRASAAKAEVLEAAAPVAVAKEEESEKQQEEEEEERKVVVAVKADAEQRRKGKARRGCRLIKRLEEILPAGRILMNPPEEAEDEESSLGDSKVALMSALNKRTRPEPEPEPEESGQDEDEDERKVVATKTEKKKTAADRHGRATTHRRKKSRRAKEEEEEEEPAAERKTKKPAAPKPKAAAMADHRWTEQRYASASASLLAVARAMGASAAEPVQRGELRAELRKRIGDTGLLDHLLKHATGTVLPGGGDRLRRRHNADGAMEYWLEPAELLALRREAGVADPYWVPPPGWKPGDPLSPDACALQAKRQVEALSAELAGVKRHMEQLMKANQGTLSIEVKSEAAKAYISHKPYQEKYECMTKANVNLEKKVLSLEEKYATTSRLNGKLEQEVLSLKEKYEAVLEKNTRLESQMAALSASFLSLKEHLLLQNGDEQEGLLLLNDNGDQPQQLLLMGPEQAPGDHLESREADKEESNDGGEAPDAAALAVGAGDGAATSSGGGGKRTSRKCSVRICRPQGAFQWPDAQPSSPLTPTAAAAAAMDGGGGLELPPTPPSASSTNAASAKLLLLPAPASPPTPSATGTGDVDLQAAAAAVQPGSGHDLQLRQPSSRPCGATAGLPESKKTALEAGGVGNELALAHPSH